MKRTAVDSEMDSRYLSTTPLSVVQGEGPVAGAGEAADGPCEGLLNEVEVTLEAAKAALAKPAPGTDGVREMVLGYASGGVAKKEAMLKAVGEKYDAAVAETQSRFRSLAGGVEVLLAKATATSKRFSSEAGRTPRELEVQRPVLHYTWGSIGLVVSSLLLLGIGTNTIATILISSGLPGFESGVRAYLFSFVPMGFALGVVGIYSLVSEARRAGFARWVWTLGLLCGAAWVVLFAQIFSGFAQSAGEVLKAVLASGAGAPAAGGGGVSSPSLVACGILSEIFLSAGCAIAARRACVVVQRAVSRPNPAYATLALLLMKLGQAQAKLASARADLRGRLESNDPGRKALLNDAEAFFGLAVGNLGRSAAKLTVLYLVLSLLQSAMAAAEPAGTGSRLLVGLPPSGTLAERRFAEAAILGLVLTNGWRGPVEAFDAHSGIKIAGFGAAKAGLSPLAKVREHGAAIAALREFLSRDTNLTAGEILIPQFAEHVGTHLLRASELPPTVLLIGSEHYSNQEKGFQIEEPLLPSADHIMTNKAASPFGTSEKRTLLQGVRVHFICRGAGSEFYRDALGQFWNAYFAQQGATLVSYSRDGETVLGRVMRGVSEPFKAAVLKPIGRLCMLKVVGDQLVEVEETSRTAPAMDVASLKEQIAARDTALQDASSRAKEAARLAAQLTAETNRLGSLAEANAQAAAAEHAELAAKLEEARQRQPRAEAQARHDALLAAGDQAESLEEKRPLYEQALALAITNRLGVTLATERLEVVRAKLAPIHLAPGVKADWARVGTENYPPCLSVELAVEDATGQPVAGLQDKDFSVLFNGERAGVKTAMVPTARAVPPLSLVIALDSSGSMEGALAQAKAAAMALLDTMAGRPGLRVNVLSFSSKIVAREWTSDVGVAKQQIASLKASGETALFDAVGAATTLLGQEAAERRLVMLTDGCNTIRTRHTPTPATLAEDLKKVAVVPYFIGLKTSELDDKTLASMARQSGGYFQMVDTAALENVFADAAKKLTRQTIRLVVTPKELPRTAQVSLAVFVGSGASMLSLERHLELPTQGGGVELAR